MYGWPKPLYDLALTYVFFFTDTAFVSPATLGTHSVMSNVFSGFELSLCMQNWMY